MLRFFHDAAMETMTDRVFFLLDRLVLDDRALVIEDLPAVGDCRQRVDRRVTRSVIGGAGGGVSCSGMIDCECSCSFSLTI
jgi:hypothetical protein